MTAGLKSMCTLATLDDIEDLRKCCGGHVLLNASGVADLTTILARSSSDIDPDFVIVTRTDDIAVDKIFVEACKDVYQLPKFKNTICD
eukprot:41065_1